MQQSHYHYKSIFLLKAFDKIKTTSTPTLCSHVPPLCTPFQVIKKAHRFCGGQGECAAQAKREQLCSLAPSHFFSIVLLDLFSLSQTIIFCLPFYPKSRTSLVMSYCFNKQIKLFVSFERQQKIQVKKQITKLLQILNGQFCFSP